MNNSWFDDSWPERHFDFEETPPTERRHVADRREGERRARIPPTGDPFAEPSGEWNAHGVPNANPGYRDAAGERVALPTGNDDAGVGKQSNPKDAIGSRKVPFSVLPWRVLVGVALAMLEGACKYGRHNYRKAGVRASVYFDAAVARHLTAWWEGEDIDADSGRHHLDKAIAGLMVLRDSQLQGNWTDDRPMLGGVDLEEANAETIRIVGMHADKHPHHWTIGDAP